MGASNFYPNQLTLRDIIQWDVRNWSKTLGFWDKNFDIKPGMKVLALGEREGGLSYYFAKKGCEVVCSDYKDFPDTTKKFHREKKVDHQISYAKVDMRKIDFADETFDVVTFKSVLGALGNKSNQDDAMNEMRRVLKKNGALLFAENSVGSLFHKYLRKKYVKWGDRWCYIPKNDMLEWTKLFSKSIVKTYGLVGAFGRSEKQRSVLGRVDSVLSPIAPRGWKYIFFGVMVK